MKFKLLIPCILMVFSLYSFDWRYYVDSYKDLQEAGITNFFSALDHFSRFGIQEKRKSTSTIHQNTNFDWQYYMQENNFQFTSEADAVCHYKKIGRSQGLSCTKPLNIIICLHLYNLDLAEELIAQVNRFMKINDMNHYSIKVTVPIGENIHKFQHPIPEGITDDSLSKIVIENTPYHKELITKDNEKKLFSIYAYLKNNFTVDAQDIQIIFAENRGVDIGGFFLCIDQIIQQNIEHDFIVKIHSKTVEGWRKLLTSFLNIHINNLLKDYDCIYSCKVQYNEKDHILNKEDAETALRLLKIPLHHNFTYPAGTMFIASRKITDFYKNKDRLALFNLLNLGFPKYAFVSLLEYGFEISFGALFDHLKLKSFILDYYMFSSYDELTD